MKQHRGARLLRGAVLLAGTMAFAGACKKEKPKEAASAPAPVFPIIAENVVIPFPLGEDFGLTVSIETPDLSGLPDALGELIRAVLYDRMDAAAYREQVTAREKAGYYEAAKDFDGAGASWNWRYDETIPERYLVFGHILVIERVRYAFTGGAHGNYGIQYVALDMDTNRLITLDDVAARDELLKRLMEEALRERLGIGPDAPFSEGGLFEDTVDIPETFFLTPEGLGFFWNPYEIGPYVMGVIEVVIPYEKLGDALIL